MHPIAMSLKVPAFLGTTSLPNSKPHGPNREPPAPSVLVQPLDHCPRCLSGGGGAVCSAS
jgi:hypothetical protein